MKLEKNAELLYMAIKQHTLKRSHALALVDKNDTISIVKTALNETVKRESILKKDVRVSTKMPTPTRNWMKSERRRHITWPEMFSILKMSWRIQ